MQKDLIAINDWTTDEIYNLFEVAKELKAKAKKSIWDDPLTHKTLGMIFHKPSLRTRVSFEVAMTQLGGTSMYLTDKEIGMGKRESIQDVARVMSRYVDGIMIRTFSHKYCEDLAQHSTIPIINGLTDLLHPCQVLGDIFTIIEKKDKIEGLKIAFLGDGNNVCNSLAIGAALVGLELSIGCPAGYEPDENIMDQAREIAKSKGTQLNLFNDAKEAVKDADVIYTDVWISMGDEDEQAARECALQPFQVNQELVSLAKPDCIVMHCLPAHRGYEITDEVMDSQQSVVFDQAENRLHTEKAIILTLLGIDI
ncbi:MAG: ornithine carbamoyltransferase [Thermoplasmata archaeon]|nr:ornithine carbamoyltransferase [Thermoplasmata archaeon]